MRALLRSVDQDLVDPTKVRRKQFDAAERASVETLMARLRATLDPDEWIVVLVSHGDCLQIAQTTFAGKRRLRLPDGIRSDSRGAGLWG